MEDEVNHNKSTFSVYKYNFIVLIWIQKPLLKKKSVFHAKPLFDKRNKYIAINMSLHSDFVWHFIFIIDFNCSVPCTITINLNHKPVYFVVHCQ